jgi:hypothetical protein
MAKQPSEKAHAMIERHFGQMAPMVGQPVGCERTKRLCRLPDVSSSRVRSSGPAEASDAMQESWPARRMQGPQVPLPWVHAIGGNRH